MMAPADEKKKPEQINPSLSRQTRKYLRKLKRSGVHGTTESAVARTLIQDQIKALIAQGSLQMEFADEDEEAEGDAS
jgi:hypothetical protein